MKIKNKTLTCLLICFLSMAGLFGLPCPSFGEQVSDVVLSLMESQKRELDTIEDECILQQKNLQEKISELNNKTQEISIKFHSLSALYENGALSPNARSILTKQINELYADLNTYYTPLDQSRKNAEIRITQLNSIIANFSIIDKSILADLDTKARTLLASYQKIKKTLDKNLPNTQKLLEEIQKLAVSFEKILPKQWLDYYINATDNIFSPLVWQNEIKNFADVFSTTARTLRNDLPNSLESWVLFAVRMIMVCLILGIPLYTSPNFTKKMPLPVHRAWKRILKESMPYIVLGIAFYYGSWQAHSIYQIGMGISAILMCYGQIQLAFILHSIQDSNMPEKPSIRIFVPVLFASLCLLTFTPLILTLSFIWTVILLFLAYRLLKAPRSAYKIPHYIKTGFFVVTIIGILITPNGLARLSILLTLLYICLGVGLYQAFGIIHLSKVIQEYIQNKKSHVFAYELGHAFLFPVLLLISLVVPFTWIFAYPGGIYIIQNISSFDFNFGTFSVNTLQIFTILIAFYLTKSIIKVINNFIDTNWNKDKNQAISSLTTPIKTTVLFGCWGLFVLYVLKVLGFSLTSLTVVAGGLSVGIGLGLQSFVQNIFSGFSLIFGQNIREGDVVDVAGISGVVQRVSLRATQIRTYDNAIVFVPNSAFLSSTFVNWTHNGTMVRKTIPIGVAYDSDLKEVMDTVMQAVKAQPDILSYPEPGLFFMNFGASSLDFELRIWIQDLDKALGIMTRVRLAINQAFKEKGIEIPFPQSDIHVYHKSGDADRKIPFTAEQNQLTEKEKNN